MELVELEELDMVLVELVLEKLELDLVLEDLVLVELELVELDWVLELVVLAPALVLVRVMEVLAMVLVLVLAAWWLSPTEQLSLPRCRLLLPREQNTLLPLLPVLNFLKQSENIHHRSRVSLNSSLVVKYVVGVIKAKDS